MTDWTDVTQELHEEGYPNFEFDSGETAVSGLSGEWVIGEIPREGGLTREHQPLWIRVLDMLPGGAVAADPYRAPTPIQTVAHRHGLDVIIVSVSNEEVRIALCDPAE